jgi:hypothetical protein
LRVKRLWSFLWPLLLVVAFVATVVFLFRGCAAEPTATERRVDSTLATVPAWKDSLRIRDSALVESAVERHRLRELSVKQGRQIRRERARADSLQAVADSASEGIPVGSASDSVTNLLGALDRQKQAAVQFRLVADSLESRHVTDSLNLYMANQTLHQHAMWRVQDQRRIDRLTKDLGDLREQTKRGKFLGFLPSWTDEALLVGAAAYGGYRLGRASS